MMPASRGVGHVARHMLMVSAVRGLIFAPAGTLNHLLRLAWPNFDELVEPTTAFLWCLVAYS